MTAAEFKPRKDEDGDDDKNEEKSKPAVTKVLVQQEIATMIRHSSMPRRYTTGPRGIGLEQPFISPSHQRQQQQQQQQAQQSKSMTAAEFKSR
eukprot:TRINITY_DN9595_c0_g1_i2.p1 TRINITY_DN9595_c0_g1~~TRINITY_DN9595_c0_g1_i2.p1  ORF type:complete len:104 (-),score=27.69 TRINITY_DN9595_c0_g1_i2:19-297(-)